MDTGETGTVRTAPPVLDLTFDATGGGVVGALVAFLGTLEFAVPTDGGLRAGCAGRETLPAFLDLAIEAAGRFVVTAIVADALVTPFVTGHDAVTAHIERTGPTGGRTMVPRFASATIGTSVARHGAFGSRIDTVVTLLVTGDDAVAARARDA